MRGYPRCDTITMSSTLKGIICGVLAAVAYGTNPLFSLNLYSLGMDVESVLFYRFLFATMGMAVLLRVRHKRILLPSRRNLPPVVIAGLIFAMSSQTLYESFLYMDAGIACSILFIYPILVAVIMMVFFRERASWLVYMCITVATAGIFLLYNGKGGEPLSAKGVALVAASSLCYSVYIVGVNRSMLASVPSGTLTFWVLLSGCMMFCAFTGFGSRLVPLEPTMFCIVNVLGVALMPTVIPILFINIAIGNIGPTYSAIIGALEPVTALFIGVMVFDETITVRIAIGCLMILLAVIGVVLRTRHKEKDTL